MPSQVLRDQSIGTQAFGALLRAHMSATKQLNAQLVADHNLTLSDYGVLLHPGSAQNVITGIRAELNQEAGIALGHLPQPDPILGLAIHALWPVHFVPPSLGAPVGSLRSRRFADASQQPAELSLRGSGKRTHRQHRPARGRNQPLVEARSRSRAMSFYQ